MDEFIIPVRPEVEFDAAIFGKFEAVAARASKRVHAQLSKSIPKKLPIPEMDYSKFVDSVNRGESAASDAVKRSAKRRLDTLRNEVIERRNMLNEIKAINTEMGGVVRIGGIQRSGGGSAPRDRAADKISGSQFTTSLRQGTSNVLGIGREVSRGMGLDFDISNSMQRNLNVSRESTQLAIQGQASDVKGTAGDIEKRARTIALETGTNVEDIIKALRAFHAYTGDLAGGMAQLQNMSESSVAYDTDIKDISSLYAVITKYLGPSGTKEGVDALVRTISTQGREGAVEIRDQIKQDPKILVGASQFGVTDSTLKAFGGDKRAAQAGIALGLQQAIMGVSGESANQSGNAVKSFMDTLSQKNTQQGLQKHGIDIFTKDKQTGKKVYKPLEELIPEMVAKAQADPTYLREMMGNVRGRKVPQAFFAKGMQAYDDTIKSGGSQADAEKAAAAVTLNDIRDISHKFQDTLSRTNDVQNFLASEAGKAGLLQASIRENLDQATKHIATTISEHRPEIEAAVTEFAGAIKWASEQPKLAMAAAFSVPMFQQAAGNLLANAITPIVAALGPFGIGILAVTALMGLFMATNKDNDPEELAKRDAAKNGAGGANGGTDVYVGGREGARNSGYNIDNKAQSDEDRRAYKEAADLFMATFKPTPGNVSGMDANSSQAQPKFDYEKMGAELDKALRNRPLQVDMVTRDPAPPRQTGVVVELR
jgi:hypothetical protein